MKCFRPEGHGQEVDNKAIKTVDGIFWSKTKMGDTMVYVGVYQVVNLKEEGASQDGLGQFFHVCPSDKANTFQKGASLMYLLKIKHKLPI